VRDAANASDLIDRARDELDLDLQVVDGVQEARLTFLGAVHSLPVEHGLVLDIGGGSLEIAQFRDRELVDAWSFPLGAVRLSDGFPMSEPPTKKDVAALHEHIVEALAGGGVPALEPGGVLVGTGGAIRNLSKVSAAATRYPLPRLHGHTLLPEDLRYVRELLCSYDVEERANVPGLNSDRADSIVAGAIATEATAGFVRATQLIVSGQGLREGIALAAHEGIPSDLAAIRRASIIDMQETFAPRWITNARRRGSLLAALREVLLPDLPADLLCALDAAGAFVDLGRDIDYYRRGRQTESLLLAHGLPGYSHREVAATCALIRQAEQEKFTVDAYAPLLTDDDAGVIAQASALLAAAEDIGRRSPAAGDAKWTIELRDGALAIVGPIPLGSRPSIARRRMSSAFGLDLDLGGSD
jgi:exopolyphosphatase/guanosine-5'-triphosphate,3'-diphosphate pyrophosphatase